MTKKSACDTLTFIHDGVSPLTDLGKLLPLHKLNSESCSIQQGRNYVTSDFARPYWPFLLHPLSY